MYEQVGELDWPAQTLHLNPTEQFWDQLEQRLRDCNLFWLQTGGQPQY